MQSKFRLVLLFSAVLLVFMSSCSKTNKEGRNIPKNAAIVVLVNGESISSKLPWEEVKKNELFMQVYNDSTIDAFVKSALDNPDNTGIDTKKDFLFFMQKDSLGGYVAIEGTVKEEAKFKKFSNDAANGGVESEKNGIHFISGSKVTSSWNKEKFVMVINAPELSRMDRYSNSFDKPQGSVTKRNGIALCTELLDLKESNSLGKDEKFTELVKEKGDIHFWMNAAELNSGSAGMAALSMLNLSKLYEGSIATATASFDNGKINVDMKSYAGKELSAIWKKYEGSEISKDMVKRLPSKDVAVFFALNFKPEGLREFVKLAGLEGFINMGSALVGFNLDDFVKANKGDIVFAMSDFKTDSTGKPDMNVIFSASVGDKAAFGKLIDAGNKLGKNKMGMGTPEVFYNTSDKYFAIGNNKESVNKYIGAGGNINPDFLDKIAGSPSAAFVNFQTLFKAFEKEATRDSLDNLIFQASTKMWENALVTGGGFKDGGTVQHFEINLVDKNTNSLKQLNNYLGIIGNIQKQKEAAREKAYSDFEFTPPVIEEDAPAAVTN